MAPPESTWESGTTEHSDFTKSDRSGEGDFDRNNYLSKIQEYVRKAETFDLREGKPSEDLRYADSCHKAETGVCSKLLMTSARHAVTRRHSGPQGKVVPLTIIDDPADWKAADLKVGCYDCWQLVQSFSSS